MFATRGGFERLREQSIFQSEIQETGTGDLNLFANFGNIELGQHVGSELARIQLTLFGERHERVRLIIAEFRITRADEHDGGIGIRQNFTDGGLQGKFNLFVRQHEGILATDAHR